MTTPGSDRHQVRVEWVETGAGLEAYVDGACVAAGDWDSAPDAVLAALARLALTRPGGAVVAEFTHRGQPLGNVLVEADGTVRDIAAGPTDAAAGPTDAAAGPTDAAAEPADADARPGDAHADTTSSGGSPPSDLGGAPDPARPAPPAAGDAAYRAGSTAHGLGGDTANGLGGDTANGLVAALRHAAPPSPTALPGVAPRPTERDRPRPTPAYEPAALPRRSRSAPPASGPRRPPRQRPRRPWSSGPRESSPRGATHVVTRQRLVVGAGAVVVVLALVLIVTVLARTRPGVTLVREETIGVTPPAEWEARSRWRTPALLKDAGRILMVDGTQMAFVTKERTVALVDAERGEVRWSARYPDGTPGTDLTATTVDGRRAVAAHVGDRLAWWELDTGEAHDVTLPAGAAVSLHGSAPLVVSDQGRTAAVVVAGRLASTPVPQGATALAARSDGIITATGAAGWWHLAPGKAAPQPVAWEHPGPAGTPTVVAYLSDTLVTVWPAPASGTAYLSIYADRPQDVRFAWGGPAWFDGKVADWFPSPSRRWGILGRTLLDLTTGRTADLGTWTTQMVSSDRAVGTLARQRVIVGPQISAGVLPNDEAFPEDLATTGAAVRATAGEDEVVYLLPPKASP